VQAGVAFPLLREPHGYGELGVPEMVSEECHAAASLRRRELFMVAGHEGLTSRRRVSVGVGPAGSGKTHTVAAGAKAWGANGGKVVGLTCAQAARNVLHAAGIRKCFNTTKLLLEVQRGMPVRPGTLFVVDEGSMVSMGVEAMADNASQRCGGPQCEHEWCGRFRAGQVRLPAGPTNLFAPFALRCGHECQTVRLQSGREHAPCWGRR
jgi:hypothetical protein